MTDEAVRRVPERVGLNSFVDRVDEEGSRERILSGGEKRRVAFARLFVHRPAGAHIVRDIELRLADAPPPELRPENRLPLRFPVQAQPREPGGTPASGRQ